MIQVINLNSGEKETYSFDKADKDAIFLSRESPIGKALLGKRLGETVKVVVPQGTLILKIIKC